MREIVTITYPMELEQEKCIRGVGERSDIICLLIEGGIPLIFGTILLCIYRLLYYSIEIIRRSISFIYSD